MKKCLFLLAGIAAIACQQLPDMTELSQQYVVWTDHDKTVDFSVRGSLCVPDSILIVGAGQLTEYWKDDDAKSIIDIYKTTLSQRGYTLEQNKSLADRGIQLTYFQSSVYMESYPMYWDPAYWAGSQYIYPSEYVAEVTVGSLTAEMVDLTASGSSLPVLWNAVMTGEVTGDDSTDLQRLQTAADQSLDQSPYL